MRSFLFLICFLFVPQVTAQDLGADSQEALDKTIQMLKDPSYREEVIDNNKRAEKAHQAVEELGGTEQQQKVYDLAADIFQNMVKNHNGDAPAMQQQLQQSPESFYQGMTPEQKARLRDLANEIEQQKGSARP